MSKHHQLNVPIEIVRTIVAIAETGSLSKAAESGGLSQPAVSSQIKRIQNLLGGEVFVRTANGTIRDLGQTNRASIETPAGSCAATFAFVARSGEQVRIAPVACR